ncbi:RNA polymerase sigma factor SigM [Bacillus haynesii]|uniref:RNA polymerase sigma factor SigM n=1 Tax=Bacillus haynesii TaxID=1925021 RepID=UPI002282C574|nr:RNA polymerase sigma factor SigM [Bacillus haynesii]MCY7771140.1 RNA polymerase sigma factor SigM [Bacillus haynesii]MCY8014417.1 RNA polymerase sigma factor SigM [Bacillus haynesii]MCY8347484.1 RNA polymerase sigma factor SigM [Bacillus haynesii]MCY8559800.1 RNA polymerase sigma factor SigM [Bacillus haynesii]MEC0783372.1 RNA polymerase sigma factor SigM [Bacillus haynesii]
MTIDEIYQMYMNDVYRFLLSMTKDKHLAEDLLQETFMRAYIHIHSYDHSKVKPWLFQVARNAFIDYVRKHKKEVTISDDMIGTLFQNAVQSPAHQVEIREVLTLYMNQLPDNYREALTLYYLKELNYKEASSLMNISEANFKSVLFRARQRLKALYNRGVNDE